MQITINVDDRLMDTLNKIAGDNSLAPEDYAGGIVQSTLEGYYRGKIIDNLSTKTIDDLSVISSVVSASSTQLSSIASQVNPII